MDTGRRNFFKNIGSKAAGVAAASIPAAISQIDFREEIKNLSDSMNAQYAKATAAIETGYQQVSNRIDAAAMTQAYQQAQIHLIFLLLLISFVIDGGMTLTWLVTP